MMKLDESGLNLVPWSGSGPEQSSEGATSRTGTPNARHSSTAHVHLIRCIVRDM